MHAGRPAPISTWRWPLQPWISVSRCTFSARRFSNWRRIAMAPRPGCRPVTGPGPWLQRCAEHGIELLLPVEGIDEGQMSAGWRRCRNALVV
jgi:hypothetical protein